MPLRNPRTKKGASALPHPHGPDSLEAVVAFGNQGSDDPEDAAALFVDALGDAAALVGEHDRRWWSARRQSVRKTLEAAASRRAAPDVEVERWVNRRLQSERHVAAFVSFHEGRLEPTCVPCSVDGVLATGVAWLYESGAARRLRQCGQCARFFFIARDLEHRRLYCSADCKVTADQAHSAERVRRWRAKQRKKRG